MNTHIPFLSLIGYALAHLLRTLPEKIWSKTKVTLYFVV